MLILTAAQIREWDRYTIANEPVSSIDLMERAAAACFEWLQTNGYLHRKFLIFCGPGNNGGDGLAIARMLVRSGAKLIAYRIFNDKQPSRDCLTNLDRAKTNKVPLYDINTQDDIQRQFDEDTVIIDAIFGTGLNEPLSGLPALLVAIINSSGKEIISIDIPSGLFADEPSGQNTTVQANHTLTFQAYKPGLLISENSHSFGNVHVLDIGLHAGFLDKAEKKFRWLELNAVRKIYKPRSAFSHKGDHGHAALVTGSKGLMGAATLCAAGCMRSGVGKLTCYVPSIGYQIMQLAVPEAMASVSGEDHIDCFEPAFDHETIGIGPGIGYKFSTQTFSTVISSAKLPMLLDADALTLLSRHPEFFEQLPKHSVLTPHPKEFDRMFGEHENSFSRIETCLRKSRELQLVIILKGHRTLIALPNGNSWFNSTGNAGMATGGSGDVLAGIITGLMAQGYTPEESALLGVYLHGLAGDLAAQELSEEGMIAGDIVRYLPKAFSCLTALRLRSG